MDINAEIPGMVRYMRSTGLSFRDIAMRSGCDVSTIYRLVSKDRVKFVRTSVSEGIFRAFLDRKEEFAELEARYAGIKEAENVR